MPLRAALDLSFSISAFTFCLSPFLHSFPPVLGLRSLVFFPLVLGLNMSNPVISVENLSKSYQLGSINTGTFYGDLQRWWAKQRGKPDPYLKFGDTDHGNRQGETLWALKDINFQVQQGEALGIIGRNGAGKSTLLKILSRVTAPTSGEIKVKGRIASLLEVGTGFHPELTGRENITLNGAIMGMNKTEISRKFDEIVDFSGVKKFIDTPVKRYSSGMYVRLAFAVAAHLEPEILIVDEVLAVGDAEFQKKCLGKMGDVAHEGRTVLFVSHNMAAVEALCSKAMIISEGKNSVLGPTPETIQRYLQGVSNNATILLSNRKDRTGKGNIRFKDIKLTGNNGVNSNVYAIGADIYIFVRVESSYPSAVTVRLALSVNTAQESLISCDSALKGKTYTIPGASESVLVCKIFSPPLNYGIYEVNLAIFDGSEPEDWIISAAKFSIESGEFDGRVTTSPFPVLSRFEWNVEGQN